MKRCAKFTIQAALFFAIITSVSARQDEDPKFTDAAAKAAKDRLAKIEAEIKSIPAHPWAGAYLAGDGLGVNTYLTLAPKSGYVFEWHGCLGLYDRNYGPIQVTNNTVTLSFNFQNKRKGFEGIAPKLVQIQWGARSYLVPADDIIGFCNRVNQGWEPRTSHGGFYLLRQGDEKLNMTDLPNVPAEYRAYLLHQPIEAKIIAVGKYTTRPSIASWKFKDTPVTLDAGSIEGLKTGMELVITDENAHARDVKITKVAHHSSEGIVTDIGEDEPSPQIGWRVSTKAPLR